MKLRVILSVGFLVLTASTVRTQTFTGSVIGLVADAQRSVFPNTTVVLIDAGTRLERRTTTSAAGEYVFRLLPPGKYTVRAKVPGFSVANIPVEVTATAGVRVDVTIQVAPGRESIEVVGENGVAVQTENANLGQTISARQFSALPSITRDPYDFIRIMAGANPSNDQRGVGVALNGQRTVSANFLLDGGENNDAFIAAPAQRVPLDAVQELTVQTNHYSAEFGRNSGFISNVVTKSGTKQIHGSIYDYVRNSVLAANTYDNNAQGFPRPVFNRHQFGGSWGGPIHPQRLFFFVSAETILVRSSGLNTFFVPTPQLLAVSSPGTQAIFERYPLPPESPTIVRRQVVCPYGVECSSGKGVMDIPAFAQAVRDGPRDAGAGAPQNTMIATGRVDWILNSKTQLFVRYAIQNKYEFAVARQPYSTTLDQPSYGNNQNTGLNILRNWSPTFATENRFVYNRVFGDPDNFTGSSPLVPSTVFPNFFFISGEATLPFGSDSFGGPQNLYQAFQTATWVHARHTLKIGTQFVHLRDNRTFGIFRVPDAVFDGVQGFVDGRLAFYVIALDPKGHFPGDSVSPPFGPPNITRHYHYKEPSLFVQDTWKANARLTVTPGLRWEYFGVFHSPGAEHSLDSNFYLGPGSNYQEQIANGRVMRTVDEPGHLQGRFYLPDYKNFAPRLGLAYDIFGDGKTVLRSGVGVYYDRMVGFELFRAFQNPPSYAVLTLRNIPATPQLLSDSYSAFPSGPLMLNQANIRAPSQNLRTAYVVSWNVTLERELAQQLVVAGSYLGASGNRLYSKSDVNRAGSGGLLNPGCITTRYASDGTTPIGPDYTNCPPLNPSLGEIPLRGNLSHSTFHAFQFRLDSKRLSRWGLQFGVNYTWSHSIDNASSSNADDATANPLGPYFLDAFNPSRDRGSSDFDERHRIAANFVWDIPLRAHASSWTERNLLHGWELSGILSYQSGQPFSIVDTGVPDELVNMARPRLVGTLPRRGPLIPDAATPNSYLYLPLNQVYDENSKCLAAASPFACGISVNGPFDNIVSRNVYRRPGTYFQDVAVAKTFPLRKESMKLQLRAEFYNVLNHPNLYVNQFTNDVASPSFTQSDGSLSAGATASFHDNRQVVVALRITF